MTRFIFGLVWLLASLTPVIRPFALDNLPVITASNVDHLAVLAEFRPADLFDGAQKITGLPSAGMEIKSPS